MERGFRHTGRSGRGGSRCRMPSPADSRFMLQGKEEASGSPAGVGPRAAAAQAKERGGGWQERREGEATRAREVSATAIRNGGFS